MAAQKNPTPYALYNESGKEVRYRKLLKAARAADVVIFGESHSDALGHWLQNVLLRDLSALDERPLALGLEMFETDQQQALEQYLAGEIDASALDKVGEGLWSNFATDYEPAIKWAHENKVKVFGTNVPRKYARQVFQEGFEGLDAYPEANGTEFAPYPFPYDPELKAYKEMVEMMPGSHAGENFPKAQAIKDATMAWRITQVLPEGGRLLHLNGSFHSDYNQGIVWYLGQYQPELTVLTISVVEQTNVGVLEKEHEGKAAFIFAVPSIMTKTY